MTDWSGYTSYPPERDMPQSCYHLAPPLKGTVLRGESGIVLAATKAFVKNVTKTNPARAELLQQITLMEQSLRDARDCEISEQKHGYLRSVLLNLFDAGDAHIIRGDHVYVSNIVHKEDWSDGKMPAHSRGGYGGFLYRAVDGEIVLEETTWIS